MDIAFSNNLEICCQNRAPPNPRADQWRRSVPELEDEAKHRRENGQEASHPRLSPCKAMDLTRGVSTRR